MKNRQAFTLVELLVVISIIALLLSILIPTLNKVREQARKVVCSTRLKDLGVVFTLYSADNHDAVPPTYPMTAEEQQLEDQQIDQHWYARIASYYNRRKDPLVRACDSIYDYTLYRCPTQDYITGLVKDAGNKKVVVSSPKTGRSIRLPENAALGIYGLNAYFSGYNAIKGDKTYDCRSLLNAKRLSSLPLLGDECAESREFPSTTAAGWLMSVAFPHPDAYKYGWPRTLLPANYELYGPAPNHRGNINYLFADMHCGSNGLWPWNDKENPREDRSKYFHPTKPR